MSEKKVVTRFAPSPTGFMHVGGVRTALFAYIFARKNNGSFILRIEDTDKEREVDGAVEQIKKSLRYILQNPDSPKAFPTDQDLLSETGNPWDQFYKQSERLDIYLEWAKALTASGFAYFDPYTKDELEGFREKAQGEKRPFLFREYRPERTDSVWSDDKLSRMPLRFKVQAVEKAEWIDVVRGNLSAGPEALDDFILMKTDGYPTYNFCHIVDDILMEVTHVMRGQEFISSTPKFIALYEALQKTFPEKNIEIPTFVTLPPILGETGTKKLSKRDGAKDVLDYHKEGFIPEALANFLAFQGWNPGGENEVYGTKKLVESFSIDRIQKSGARWNPVKLEWFNKEYMKELYNFNQNVSPNGRGALKLEFLKYLPESLQKKYDPFPIKPVGAGNYELPSWHYEFETLFEKYLERISYLNQLREEPILSELSIFTEEPIIDTDLIYSDLDKNETIDILQSLPAILYSHANAWDPESLKESLSAIIKEKGTKNVLWPLRTALSGRKKSLDPFSLLSILGKTESVSRILSVVEKMK
jgi:glutamyl-tRNA synthetase